LKSRGNGEFEKNEEIKQLYQMPDIIRETKKKETPMGRTCMNKRRDFNSDGSMWDREGKRPLG